MKKRIAAILLLGCMVMGSVVTPAQVSAAEVSETATEAETEQTSEETSVNTAAAESTETAENAETAEITESAETAESTELAESVKAAAANTTESGTEAAAEELVHPTGLMDLNVINVGTIAEDDVLDETEVNSNKSSSVYAAEWDSYSSNYVYNMLSTEEREFWDGLDASCRQVLLGTDNLTAGRIPYVSCGSLNANEITYVAYMFRYMNPQYYFINVSLYQGSSSSGWCAAFGVYSAFQNGTARSTATQSVKNQVDTWKNTVNSLGSEAEKVKMIHDLIVEKVDYNYDISNSSSFNEDTAYTQSVYSVFCMDKTVCAGYAQAFEMMCNGVGVDCIAVTSDDHEWNKVRINDSWYNVDCNWADQSTIDYEYFERSDAVYDADLASYASSHAEESYWSEYLPACTLDSGATSSDPGTLPTITQQTAQPQISVTANNNVNYVTITSSTPNAIIYYTTNGDTPTPAYTRSEKYSSTFTLGGSCTVKAVAVCDTYWDSNVASKSVTAATGTTGTTDTPDTTDTTTQHKSAPFVKLLYQYVLDRSATQSEVDYWVGRLENGSTGAEVAYGFIFSQEFQNKNYSDADYVEHLYLSLMGRASDADGKADWVTHLKNGASRLYVFRQFTDSAEFGNLCNTYEIQRGTVTLNENRDQNYNVTRFVARNYTEFLGRTYDVDGLNDWSGRINSGYGMENVAYGFVFSQECINMNLSNSDYVKMLYRGIFGRSYDDEGLNDWVNQLNNGTSRETVFWGFANSQEFANMVASYGL